MREGAGEVGPDHLQAVADDAVQEPPQSLRQEVERSKGEEAKKEYPCLDQPIAHGGKDCYFGRMIEFSNLYIDRLALHQVGNKHRGEANFFSDSPLQPDEKLQESLVQYFIQPMKKADAIYRLHHAGNLELNPVYHYAHAIFENPENFQENSVHLARQLYEQSDHPNIRSGEVYVAYFRDVQYEDELVDAVGIFKAERKSAFLRWQEAGSNLSVDALEGTDIDKPDKGCLILRTQESDGYRVLSIDHNKYDALYWPERFLGIVFVEDHHYHTRRYLELIEACSQSVAGDQKEQVQVRANSIEYFRNHETFQPEEFAREVFAEPEAREAFQQLQADFGLQEIPPFPISQQAFQQAKRKWPSQIRLDTHIQIKLDFSHPDAADKYLVRGYDEERGMYFYKVYFNAEE